MDLNLPSEKQYAIWREMTYQDKYNLFLPLMHTERALKTAGVKLPHPDWDDERVSKEVARIYLHAGS